MYLKSSIQSATLINPYTNASRDYRCHMMFTSPYEKFSKYDYKTIIKPPTQNYKRNYN